MAFWNHLHVLKHGYLMKHDFVRWNLFLRIKMLMYCPWFSIFIFIPFSSSSMLYMRTGMMFLFDCNTFTTFQKLSVYPHHHFYFFFYILWPWPSYDLDLSLQVCKFSQALGHAIFTGCFFLPLLCNRSKNFHLMNAVMPWSVWAGSVLETQVLMYSLWVFCWYCIVHWPVVSWHCSWEQ